MDLIRDLLRTRCFININFKDLQPTIHYYKTKSHLNLQQINESTNLHSLSLDWRY